METSKRGEVSDNLSGLSGVISAVRRFPAVIRVTLCAMLAASAASKASAASAQIIRDAVPARTTAAAADSAALAPAALSVIDSARTAQIQFEAYRRNHLPHTTSRRPPNCDERVGKLCYWYMEGAVPPKELPEVAEKRLRLLNTLDSLGRLAPTSIWIVEARVRYYAESERYDDALRAARECKGEGAGNGWRCEILVGFALHLLGEFVEAERTYDSAISHMGALESCAWRDISLLLDDVARAQFRAYPCGTPQRDAWVARTWFLARTLYSMKGNDSRTEYFARMTMVQMLQDAPGAYQGGFNEDEREILLRFGWVRSWAAEYVLPFTLAMGDTGIIPRSGTGGTMIGAKGKGKGGTNVGSYPPGVKIPESIGAVTKRPPDIQKGPLPGGAGGAPDNQPTLPRIPLPQVERRDGDGISVVGMEPMPAYRYIPAGFVLNDPPQSDSAAWRLQLAPVMGRYAPAYAKSLVALEHQKAVFKRGDSALVVMAYETRGNAPIENTRLRAGLVVTPGNANPRDYAARLDSAPTNGVLTVRAPWGPLLMSAEVAAPDRKAVARARYGVGPERGLRARVILSDLLFYKPNGSIPTSVEEVAPLALRSERVRAKEKLGVYWEAYGTDPGGEKVHVALVVMREAPGPDEGGLLRRMGRVLQGSRDATPVSVSVDDVSARGTSTSTRAIELDISTLSQGSYVVQLEITVAGQPTLRAEHRIEVVAP